MLKKEEKLKIGMLIETNINYTDLLYDNYNIVSIFGVIIELNDNTLTIEAESSLYAEKGAHWLIDRNLLKRNPEAFIKVINKQTINEKCYDRLNGFSKKT